MNRDFISVCLHRSLVESVEWRTLRVWSWTRRQVNVGLMMCSVDKICSVEVKSVWYFQLVHTAYNLNFYFFTEILATRFTDNDSCMYAVVRYGCDIDILDFEL